MKKKIKYTILFITTSVAGKLDNKVKENILFERW